MRCQTGNNRTWYIAKACGGYQWATNSPSSFTLSDDHFEHAATKLVREILAADSLYQTLTNAATTWEVATIDHLTPRVSKVDILPIIESFGEKAQCAKPNLLDTGGVVEFIIKAVKPCGEQSLYVGCDNVYTFYPDENEAYIFKTTKEEFSETYCIQQVMTLLEEKVGYRYFEIYTTSLRNSANYPHYLLIDGLIGKVVDNIGDIA